jgi:hypothetical protein
MFANILSIFPSFHDLTDEKKFLYLFQCGEYDIVEVTGARSYIFTSPDMY